MTDRIKKYRGWWYMITFSPDDGGFYGEVFDSQGKNSVETELVSTKGQAIRDCKKLIDGRHAKED